MAFLYEYGMFLIKAITIVAAIVATLASIISLREKNNDTQKWKIEITDLSEELEDIKLDMQEALSNDEDDKKNSKSLEQDKKNSKAWWQFWKKKIVPEKDKRNFLFVIDFDGDVEAEEAQALRQEVTAILQVATEQDEILVRLKSPGGVVHGYGLAASQLARIKDAKLPLTVAVDEVAASGGYLMACVADKILASPFAIIGSIGVVAQLPNFHRLLKKYDIDYEQFTAGKFKRTVTMFGENTEEAKEKFKEELEAVHRIFQTFVGKYRPQVDLEVVATGEHWLACDAKDLNLVDELLTSDTYLQERTKVSRVIKVKYIEKISLNKKLAGFLGKLNQKINL